MTDENHQVQHPDKQVAYCTASGSTIAHDKAGDEYQVTHHCRYPAEHEGQTHQCWLCTTTWTDEVPC